MKSQNNAVADTKRPVADDSSRRPRVAEVIGLSLSWHTGRERQADGPAMDAAHDVQGVDVGRAASRDEKEGGHGGRESPHVHHG